MLQSLTRLVKGALMRGVDLGREAVSVDSVFMGILSVASRNCINIQ